MSDLVKMLQEKLKEIDTPENRELWRKQEQTRKDKLLQFLNDYSVYKKAQKLTGKDKEKLMYFITEGKRTRSAPLTYLADIYIWSQETIRNTSSDYIQDNMLIIQEDILNLLLDVDIDEKQLMAWYYRNKDKE